MPSDTPISTFAAAAPSGGIPVPVEPPAPPPAPVDTAVGVPPTPPMPAEPVVALPAPELPADLSAATPLDSVDDDHGDDGAPVAVSPGDLATSWTVARHSTRYDDPPGDRIVRLLAVPGDSAVAATADAVALRADAAVGGATWAIVTAVTDVGDGWWRVEFTLKRTQLGQVGPTSTPSTLDVHVANGVVDGERP